MSFVNKKESVIQIELTPFGKRKLAKGNFKPDHYRFFDDDIIYDNEYTGVEDEINEAQDRIKNSIRLEPQYLSYSIEESFDIESKQIELGEKDLFEELRQTDNTEKSEKLLSFPLGTMNLASQEAPAFTLKSWNNMIVSPSVVYDNEENTGIKTPQLKMSLTHSVTVDTTNTVEVDNRLYNSESFEIDLTDEEVTFLDGSKMIQKTEPILISLEESNVQYLRENFDLEIFEIVTIGDESIPDEIRKTLVKMDDPQEILKYFDISVDESVQEIPKMTKVNKNFFAN